MDYCTSWTQLLSGKSSYWIPHQLILPKELMVSLQVFVKNCHMIRFETDLWEIRWGKTTFEAKVQSTSKIIKVKPSLKQREKRCWKSLISGNHRFVFLSAWHLRVYDCWLLLKIQKSWIGILESEHVFRVVVSKIFYFHPYLGKTPILTNIFQIGWNHQLDYPVANMKQVHTIVDPEPIVVETSDKPQWKPIYEAL